MSKVLLTRHITQIANLLDALKKDAAYEKRVYQARSRYAQETLVEYKATMQEESGYYDNIKAQNELIEAFEDCTASAEEVEIGAAEMEADLIELTAVVQGAGNSNILEEEAKELETFVRRLLKFLYARKSDISSKMENINGFARADEDYAAQLSAILRKEKADLDMFTEQAKKAVVRGKLKQALNASENTEEKFEIIEQLEETIEILKDGVEIFDDLIAMFEDELDEIDDYLNNRFRYSAYLREASEND